MGTLEVLYADGQVDSVALSKKQTVSIGKHSTCDVRIDEDDVGTLHCRVAWNGSGFEVTSAHAGGVDLNGSLVRHQTLRDGDLIRIGSVDLTVRLDEPALASSSSAARRATRTSGGGRDARESGRDAPPRDIPTQRPASRDVARDSSRRAEPEDEFYSLAKPVSNEAPSDDIGLAPISEEFPTKRAALMDRLVTDGDPARQPSLPHANAPPSAPPAAPPRTPSLPPRAPHVEAEPSSNGQSDDDIPVAEVVPTAEIVLPRRSTRDDEDDWGAPAPSKPATTPAQQSGQQSAVSEWVSARARRPGERDPLRSPLVLSLAGGTVVLALAALVVWFLIHRGMIQKEFDAAFEELNQGRFTQAAERFEKFLEDHPRHHYAVSARRGLGRSLISREIAGSTPSWPRGLEALEKFAESHRNEKDFADLQSEIAANAEKIALGAAKAAEAARKKDLLTTSAAAAALLTRFGANDADQEKRRRQIALAVTAAETAIARQDTFDASLGEIDAALAAKQPAQAFAARRTLLEKYPTYHDQAKLKALLDKTLSLEKELVAREETNRQAERDERPSKIPPPLTLAPHPRSRTDEVSDGRTVAALSKDCLYGIDAVTGDPLWRRVVGFDAPFFPIPVSTSLEGWLVFDTRHHELLLLDRRTGRLAWRQEIGAPLNGPPLIHEGQIYLPADDQTLHQIDLETGKSTTRLRFPQKLRSPPVLVAGESKLVVAGEGDSLFTLTLRPLEIDRATFFGHRAGSIVAPPLALGKLVLLAENDRQSSARLRVLDASGDGTWLAEVASQRVDGLVRDRPALRGKELFVPSSDERVTSFVVSDKKGQPPLSPAVGFQVPQARPTPVSLAVGPDGQLWMSSSALRRLSFKGGAVKLDGPVLAEGIASQPMQAVGKTLFVGRKQPFSDAVLFTQADREQMVSPWRTVLGAAPLLVVPGADGLVCLTEQGDLFRVGSRDLSAGGFKLEPAASLKLPDGLSEPLRAFRLAGDRIAVTCGGTEPTLWLLSRSGQVEQELKLEGPLEANPVLLAGGLVLPYSGRLKFLSSSGGGKVDDLRLPAGDEPTPPWKQLLEVDGTTLLTIDAKGRVARVQHRTAPLAHLAETADVDLKLPVDIAATLADGQLYVADAGGAVQVLDVARFEPRGKATLDAPATALFVVKGRLFVATGGKRLTAFSTEGPLKESWSVDLRGAPAGPPVTLADQYVVVDVTGTATVVKSDTGGVSQTAPLGQAVAGGPMAVGANAESGMLIVPTLDGSFLRIETAVSP